MSAPHIALATCRDLPDWEVDDTPFHAALRNRGVRLEQPIWNDPAVDWTAFDAVLIRTTWDYQEHRDDFVAWAERCAQATRLFNDPRVVRWNTHKSYLHDLHRTGVRLAPTAWLWRGHRVDVEELCRTHRWQRAFLKPMVGATARETLRFACDAAGFAAAQAHVDRLLPDEDLILQSYLDSVERDGELSAIWIDGRFSHGVRKVPVPGDYRVQDDWGASDEPHQFTAAELQLAGAVVERVGPAAGLALDAPLYARVDFLRDGEGQLVLNELELVEPSLFFRHGPQAPDRLAQALLARCSAAPTTGNLPAE